jgi:phage protein D
MRILITFEQLIKKEATTTRTSTYCRKKDSLKTRGIASRNALRSAMEEAKTKRDLTKQKRESNVH